MAQSAGSARGTTAVPLKQWNECLLLFRHVSYFRELSLNSGSVILSDFVGRFLVPILVDFHTPSTIVPR
jgi:hypothetical protein